MAMRTFLLTAILGLLIALPGCVEVNTIPTQIDAGDNVDNVDINKKEVPTGGF